jgi:hypothetical protein
VADALLYEDGVISITTGQAVFPAATYRVAAIQAVGKQPLPERAGWSLLACGLPGLIALLGGTAAHMDAEQPSRVVALLVAAVFLLGLAACGGYRLLRVPAARYGLTIAAGGKTDLVLVTADEDLIDAVRGALEQAMARHPAPAETGFLELEERRRLPRS